MADKEVPLSIVIQTIDKATAGIRAVNERISSITAPVKAVGAAFGRLADESGLEKVGDAFSKVGGAVKDLLVNIAKIGIGAVAAVLALKSIILSYDDLGDAAERIGVSVDRLASLRFAAEKAGAPVEALDEGMKAFNRNLGQVSAGTGRLTGFLEKVSPALLKQVKAAKTSEEAFGLIAQAVEKVKDPMRRAALAQAAFGGAGADLVPLLAKGRAGVKELTDRYLELAGSQAEAAEAGGGVDDALHDLQAATDGVKAAIVTGLAPAFVEIINELRAFFTENRGRIKEWVTDFGKKLPGAIHAFAEGFQNAIDAITPVWNAIGGLKGAAIALAAVITGKLIIALVQLGVVLLTNPIGLVIAAVGLLIAAGIAIVANWDYVKGFFVECWAVIKDAFAAFFDWVWPVLHDFTPIGFIVDNWQPISDFFKALWDGITDIFAAAWADIKKTVDNVIWAVDKIKDAAGAVTDFLGITDEKVAIAGTGVGADGIPNSRRAALGAAQVAANQAAAPPSEARIKVDFANAPKGTRVTADPRGKADVDLSVGYQMVMP